MIQTNAFVDLMKHIKYNIQNKIQKYITFLYEAICFSTTPGEYCPSKCDGLELTRIYF